MKTTTLLVAPLVGASVLAFTANVASAEPPPPAPCTAVPEGLTLVVPADGGLALVTSEGAAPLDVQLRAQPTIAGRGPDGTVWAEIAVDDDTDEVYRIPTDGDAVASAGGEVSLLSIGWLGERTASVIIARTNPGG